MQKSVCFCDDGCFLSLLYLQFLKALFLELLEGVCVYMFYIGAVSGFGSWCPCKGGSSECPPEESNTAEQSQTTSEWC